jgi:hypothetical protein
VAKALPLSPCVAPARPGRNPSFQTPFPLSRSPPGHCRCEPPGKARAMPAAGGCLLPGARRTVRGRFLLWRRCGLVEVDEAWHGGAGELRQGCPLAVEAVVRTVAEWRRPLPTPAFRSDEGPRWPGGLLRGGAADPGGGDADDIFFLRWRAESGLIWLCRGLGGPMVARNGPGGGRPWRCGRRCCSVRW